MIRTQEAEPVEGAKDRKNKTYQYCSLEILPEGLFFGFAGAFCKPDLVSFLLQGLP
jgi:hypothetical protein